MPTATSPAGPPPRGVRLVAPDGTVIPCDVLYDPDRDENGVKTWVAVPVAEVSWTAGDWNLEAVLLPEFTALVLEVPQGAELIE